MHALIDIEFAGGRGQIGWEAVAVLVLPAALLSGLLWYVLRKK